MEKARPLDCCCSHQFVSGLTVDILNTFCGVFMVRRIKLMLRIFELRVLLFDCCVYRQNVV